MCVYLSLLPLQYLVRFELRPSASSHSAIGRSGVQTGTRRIVKFALDTSLKQRVSCSNALYKSGSWWYLWYLLTCIMKQSVRALVRSVCPRDTGARMGVDTSSRVSLSCEGRNRGTSTAAVILVPPPYTQWVPVGFHSWCAFYSFSRAGVLQTARGPRCSWRTKRHFPMWSQRSPRTCDKMELQRWRFSPPPVRRGNLDPVQSRKYCRVRGKLHVHRFKLSWDDCHKHHCIDCW